MQVGNGGLGSTTYAGARDALGLGTAATQNSNAINITGGSITGITDLSIADGGTGASTVVQARTNLGLVIGADIQPFSNELVALASLNTNGLITKTSTGVVSRTITAGNAVTVTNGDGILGNPVINLSSELVALSTLNTTGVINRTSSGVQTVAPSTSGNILTSNGTTWTSAPPVIPPQTGLGIGQTWQLVSRSTGVNYTNNTGKPIAIWIGGSTQGFTSGGYVAVSVGAVTLNGGWAHSGAVPAVAWTVVPNGQTYSYTSLNVPSPVFYELR